MVHSDVVLNGTYDRTGGLCHVCGRALCWSNYGRLHARGAWEVDHSVPRAKGGTNRANNLLPAHISCNRSKQARSSQSIRRALMGQRAIPKRPEADGGWPLILMAAVGAIAVASTLTTTRPKPRYPKVEVNPMSQVRMAHLQEQDIHFAVFEADSADRTAYGRSQVLTRLQAAAREAGLRVDKAVLAFMQGGRITFFGATDLARYLAGVGWRPAWTHTLDVGI